MCSYMLVLTVCPFGLKQIVSTNKMINISKSLETSHFIHRTRTYSQSSNFARITILRNGVFSPLLSKYVLFVWNKLCSPIRND